MRREKQCTQGSGLSTVSGFCWGSRNVSPLHKGVGGTAVIGRRAQLEFKTHIVLSIPSVYLIPKDESVFNVSFHT